MARWYLIIALVVQGSFTYANQELNDELSGNPNTTNDNLELNDDADKDFHNIKKDWIDFFLQPDMQLFPSSSVTMISQATMSEKPVEEQLADIKEATDKITVAIQSEMATLLSYALGTVENDNEKTDGDNQLRKKRSIETPMDSTKLITRLLKHIKSNNEYQNIAIEKMMTAQEIADKYGIEFSPDTEIISDLAFAANEQAREMNSLLHDTLQMKNSTKNTRQLDAAQNTQYVYPQPEYEQKPYIEMSQPVINHHHHTESYPSNNYHNINYPYESQIPSPNYYNAPVTTRPNFYDAVSYSPDYYPPYCSMDPFSAGSSDVLYYDEPNVPEPELAGEEFEETVSSKLYVDRGDEPGSATVNHVMTYTIGEKSHFRAPEIQRLPQQLQYCFFLL